MPEIANTKTAKNPSMSREKRAKALLPGFIALLLFLAAQVAWSAQVTIIHAQTSNDPKEKLMLDILKLAISKSGSGDRYTYQEYPEGLTEARLLSLIQDGRISVMWAGMQEKYERDLHPIRIPILKGLLGHRIFIIRQGDQSLFDRVDSFADLQEIPLGQGRFWGDTAILKNAGLKVVDPVKYQSLFYMLEGGRFDYFPRAVHEPWSEVASRPELDLTVEENLLLIYPFAMYFFVDNSNKQLGRVIETGFRNAIEDGSFDETFFSHPMIKNALENANLKERTIFHLPNPNMTPETPVDEPELWLNIEDL